MNTNRLYIYLYIFFQPDSLEQESLAEYSSSLAEAAFKMLIAFY